MDISQATKLVLLQLEQDIERMEHEIGRCLTAAEDIAYRKGFLDGANRACDANRQIVVQAFNERRGDKV